MIPLLTCSARLPVFALLIGFFIKDAFVAGLAMSLLYFLSLAIGLFVAILLNLQLREKQKSYLMLEIPPYRWPKLYHVIQIATRRTTYYVKKAGPIIVVLSLVLWSLMHFPYRPELSHADQVQQSVAAHVGQKMNPVFEPMGVDWRVGVALLGSFAAREVFVPTLALTFGVQDENEESMLQSLNKQMHSIFNLPSILALIFFFSIALQCMSTFAILVRETGSWRLPLLQLFIYNSVAYLLSVVVYQTLS